MKRTALVAVLILALACFSASALAFEGGATSYDLFDYWMTTPGQWVNLTDGSGIEIQMICETAADGGVPLATYLLGETNTLVQRTDRTAAGLGLVFTGEYNGANGVTQHMPPLSAPRYMIVGQGVQGSHVERNAAGTQTPVYSTLYLDAAGLTITSGTETFTDVIRLVQVDVDHDSSITNVYFMAKGVGIVMYHQAGIIEAGSEMISLTSQFTYVSHGPQ